MGRVIYETNLIDIVIAGGLACTSCNINIRSDTIVTIKVIVISILDSRFAYIISPITIPTRYEKRFVQIARVRHGVLFVHHNLVEQICQLSGARNWHAAVEHFGIKVIVSSARVV